MSLPSIVGVLVTAILFAACTSTREAADPDAQHAVESIAALYPDCLRLTVHGVPPAGGARVAVASTLPAERGLPCDPEDLEAMESGRTIVRQEPGALDFTVPIRQRGTTWTAACGVTLQAEAGADRDQLRVRAQQIARSVELTIDAHSMPR